mmetsp:Transcript_31058/g.71795  ORF Transcript_31058/g.71795 Transcript_31058/m.71795 type:complete len:204 (+) Transcript_31058:62-673(+)
MQNHAYTPRLPPRPRQAASGQRQAARAKSKLNFPLSTQIGELIIIFLDMAVDVSFLEGNRNIFLVLLLLIIENIPFDGCFFIVTAELPPSPSPSPSTGKTLSFADSSSSALLFPDAIEKRPELELFVSDGNPTPLPLPPSPPPPSSLLSPDPGALLLDDAMDLALFCFSRDFLLLDLAISTRWSPSCCFAVPFTTSVWCRWCL